MLIPVESNSVHEKIMGNTCFVEESKVSPQEYQIQFTNQLKKCTRDIHSCDDDVLEKNIDCSD